MRLRHAATMIVLREAAGEIEVLMTHRHADLAFMGGMWVFPGGALATADQSDAARELTTGRCAFELHDLQGARVPEPLCTAFAIAACRETFEEAGILLARKTDGSAPDAAQLGRLRSERAQLSRDPAQFIAALAREGLRLDVDRIVYWTHWITPSGVSRRFDTRFFVAPAPDTHELLADTYETTECVWMSPRARHDSPRRGSMKLAQPTRYTLEDLRASIEAHGTLDALLSREAHRDVAPIMPKLIQENGTSTIVMPWDPQYADAPGEGVQPGRSYPPALVALPSRTMRDH
jgi:8-oxo-dGTP pyrophosphatase MutT (NUDIX family)